MHGHIFLLFVCFQSIHGCRYATDMLKNKTTHSMLWCFCSTSLECLKQSHTTAITLEHLRSITNMSQIPSCCYPTGLNFCNNSAEKHQLCLFSWTAQCAGKVEPRFCSDLTHLLLWAIQVISRLLFSYCAFIFKSIKPGCSDSRV